MRLGIIGLPNVGKSSLFNAITRAGAEVANYPFCTIEPNVGTVAVPDERVLKLSELYNPKKVTFATVDFVDIAGLVKGASRGEGLGNQFLANIREVDALIHVVRCFDDPQVVHVDGRVDPQSDIETINLELIFADLEYLERRLAKIERLAKDPKKVQPEQVAFYQRLYEHLSANRPVRTLAVTDEESTWLAELALLTQKPILYVANVAEEEVALQTTPCVATVREIARDEQATVVVISARIEQEIALLSAEEQQVFLADLGLKQSGLDKIIQAGYSLLGQISFLTAGEQEVRAWTVRRGTPARQAAGKIHSDLERGFIRAEVVPYPDLIACGGLAAAREKGLVRSEGKDYQIVDGDVVLIRFNV